MSHKFVFSISSVFLWRTTSRFLVGGMELSSVMFFCGEVPLSLVKPFCGDNGGVIFSVLTTLSTSLMLFVCQCNSDNL